MQVRSALAPLAVLVALAGAPAAHATAAPRPVPTAAASVATARCADATTTVVHRHHVSCRRALAIVARWRAVPDSRRGNHGSAQLGPWTCAGQSAAGHDRGLRDWCSTDDGRRFEITRR